MAAANYVTRVFSSPAQVDATQWNALLALEPDASPFLQHAYLLAMHESGCARHPAGWQAQFLTLWHGDTLQAACPLYLKNHSYGEYVFDWAWANAYAQHGLDYYPKALVAVPFTPVPGARLLARDAPARTALVEALIQHTRDEQLSSLHLLFVQPHDVKACEEAGMLLRHTVQFHWKNVVPTLPEGDGPALGRPGGESAPRPFTDFDDFLASLVQEKRKKIRQERRKVTEAGVSFRHAEGACITEADWAFFYRCYERTYLEHGNAPYLNWVFFQRMARDMPQNWLMFIAERDGQPIASSLIALDVSRQVAYGRYWGALERVDCLHFEACYYQPLAWCIANGVTRFEGGAQGEQKMARALLPVRTTSAHWLAHPSFADAVERFLEREGQGIDQYLTHLSSRSPLKSPQPGGTA
ncbi:GNAT family N-acetyltransferase [Hydrogenophaga sp.]|uniref:GNAT family N-acetyltransferase n=1 Tax=Hydrogenophaga sp. TaxID=1904254 RepID=UPI0025BF8A5B|nr:GNAT family N-acetyltransferase [Hydrogenophaga sp.]